MMEQTRDELAKELWNFVMGEHRVFTDLPKIEQERLKKCANYVLQRERQVLLEIKEPLDNEVGNVDRAVKELRLDNAWAVNRYRWGVDKALSLLNKRLEVTE